MGVIKALDPSVVNKIAAGEIIIAPANALKEMLENSIDAGSTTIQVLVKDGGIKMLQITDNGSGIMKDDLPILCERFTTSKLQTFEDLNSIATYGFRGEALASISHIAHLTVTTKTKASPCAYRCRYSQGNLVPQKPGDSPDPKPIAGKNGTQLTVENLFYNFTSRLKSLKSPNEEFMRIIDVVNKYAIHTANVGFSVKKVGESHNAMTIRESQNVKERIRTVYGSNVANNLVPIDVPEGNPDYGLLLVNGQVSNMNYNTNKKATQAVFFINNRLVNCDPLKKSLLNIFSIYLPKGAKPFIYLSLSIRPNQLDVNIHPTKKEVRFLHEDEIIDFICQKVQDQLSSVDDLRVFRTQMVLSQKIRERKKDDDNDEESKKEKAPTPKRQKMSLSQRSLRSFKYGDQPPVWAALQNPKRQDNKFVRVDSSQTKITSFILPQPVDKSTQNDETNEGDNDNDDGKDKDRQPVAKPVITIDEGSQDTIMNDTSIFEVDSSALESDFPMVDKENFTFIANERTKITLESIVDLREEIEKGVNKELTEVFSNVVLVGIVQYSTRMLTFQLNIGLFLVDYGKLFYHLFYQIGLSDFSNFGKIFLKQEVSIKQCAQYVISEISSLEDYDQLSHDEFLNEAISQLVSMKNMYEEYFSIIIDATDPQDPKLVSLPLILKNYLPSMAKLPIFLYKLLSKIDYFDEKICLKGILNEIALFYVPDSVLEFDAVKNGDETEEMLQYDASVEHLLAVVKRRFLATDDMLNSIIEVANLPSLYKCFERC